MALKRAMALVAVVLMVGIFSFSQAAMSRAEKRYKFVVFTCSQFKSGVQIIREFVNIFENQESKKVNLKELDVIEKKINRVLESTQAKKNQIPTADKSFLASELNDMKLIGSDIDKWEAQIRETINDEDIQNDPIKFGKMIVFTICKLDEANRQMVDIFDQIDNLVYQDEIKVIKKMLKGSRPAIKYIIKQAKEIEKKKLALEDLKKALEKLGQDLVPIQQIHSSASKKFSAMYFEEYDQEDFRSLLSQ